jgi:hypothetical protein
MYNVLLWRVGNGELVSTIARKPLYISFIAEVRSLIAKQQSMTTFDLVVDTPWGIGNGELVIG